MFVSKKELLNQIKCLENKIQVLEDLEEENKDLNMKINAIIEYLKVELEKESYIKKGYSIPTFNCYGMSAIIKGAEIIAHRYVAKKIKNTKKKK